MSEPIHIVCAHCDSIVRVPRDRIGELPRCPQCHAALLGGPPLALRSHNAERHLTRNGLPIIVDFWAPWCGPCRMMAPHFEQAALRHATRARFAKVNSDDEPALSSRFGIRSIPTLIAFRDGQEIARQSGAMDLGNLERWIGAIL